MFVLWKLPSSLNVSANPVIGTVRQKSLLASNTLNHWQDYLSDKDVRGELRTQSNRLTSYKYLGVYGDKI